MKENEIEIGKLYRNTQFENVRYLGVGRYTVDEESNVQEIDLGLVVITDPDTDSVGTLVAPPDRCFPGFWDDFESLENFNR